MKKLLTVTLVMVFVLGLMGGVAGATYDFPSTNELNRDKEVPGREGQDAPHVNLVSAGADYVELEFVNNTNSLAFFEYRVDGEALTDGTHHPVVTDCFIYPGVSVDGRKIDEPVIVLETFNADEKVEIRLALGGERDWDFDWTPFYVEPAIEYEAAPAVAARLLDDAGVDNRYGQGRDGGNFIADVARHMEDTTDFDGVSKEDVGAYECAVAAFLNDPANGDYYPAGVECMPQYELFEELTVDSEEMDGTDSSALDDGVQYKFKVSGTWENQNGAHQVDAGYNNYSGEWEAFESKNLQLQVNEEFVDWGDFNDDHIYYLYFEGKGDTVNFRIFDGRDGEPIESWYNDNEGTLEVKIYTVNW